MGWYKRKTLKHTFGDVGYPELWVELLLPGSFLYGEVKEMQAITQKDNTVGPTLEADNVQTEGAEIVFQKEIIAWNICHPETNNLLPLPSEDVLSLNFLPIEFFNSIQAAIETAVKLTGPNLVTPNGSGDGSKEQVAVPLTGQEKSS